MTSATIDAGGIMVDIDNPVIELTTESRCDRCGAQAYTLAEREDAGELLFCGHHFRENKAKLREGGWTIVHDTASMERDLIPVPV